MARTRALDHDEKRLAILEQSAQLFAAEGFDRVSVSMLARACDISKALLYHYFKDKSELLFEIIRDHLQTLLAVTAESDEAPTSDPREHLHWLVHALLEAYRSANSKHQVQINQLHLLPGPQQKLLKDMERKLVDRFAAAIARCVPPSARDRALLKPLTMSLFGMVNWHYLWFREDGSMSRGDYAQLAVTLLIEGSTHLPMQSTGGRPINSNRPPAGRDPELVDGKQDRWPRNVSPQPFPDMGKARHITVKGASATRRRSADGAD